jgi:hypothetical protein
MKPFKPLLLSMLAGLTALNGQTTTVPELLSYQAYVADVSGNPIGGAQPVNRSAIFKLYDAATGGNLLYAETQTVTISGGSFSVLIGNGTGISGLPGPSAPANPSGVRIGSIAKSPLFLGITVDDGTPAADPEISPRQQLVSSAFTLRAAVAESLVDGSLKTDMVVDGSITTSKILAGSVDNSRIANSAISAAKLANSSVTASKIDTTQIGIWTPSGSHVYRPSGTNVGIGETSPAFPLHFASTAGNKIALFGSSGNHYGIGTQTNLMQFYSNGSGADIAFGFGSSSAFTENVRFKGDGNVGMGTSSPSQKLHVVGNVLAAPDNWSSGGTAYLYLGDTSNHVSATQGGVFALRAAGPLVFRSGGDSERIRVDSNGNVGVNTNSPGDRLHVSGGLRANSVLANSLRTSHSQGAHLEWNKASGPGATYLLNQKGSGAGGFVIGEVSTADAITERIRIDGDGRVRIGTTANLGLLNVGTVLASYTSYGRLTTNGGNDSNSDYTNVELSLNADGRVLCTQVDIASDERLKTGFRGSSSAEDLETLLGIRVTDYQYVDRVAHGGSSHKKVLAQQIEQVFPQAVTKTPGTIPDVYRHARISGDWLEIDGDFQPGDRLLVMGDDDRERTLTVSAVRDGAVRIEDSGFSGDVFVYGRHVDDLRRVDYDAIAMLNVSATQELHRQLVAGQQQAAAKDRRIEDLERRLEAIEKLVGTGH